MVLGDVEETVTTTEQDEETMETIIKVSCLATQPCGLGFVLFWSPRFPSIFAAMAMACAAYVLMSWLGQKTKRTMEMLFVRGDTVILVSPPLRTG